MCNSVAVHAEALYSRLSLNDKVKPHVAALVPASPISFPPIPQSTICSCIYSERCMWMVKWVPEIVGDEAPMAMESDALCDCKDIPHDKVHVLASY